MKFSPGISGWMLTAVFQTGCVSMHHEAIEPTSTITAAVNAVTTDQQAIGAAQELLKHHHADWGPPMQVLRTRSDWYRIEYAHASTQAERVVLVDPMTGKASFPLPR
jgi:hypothetical protein